MLVEATVKLDELVKRIGRAVDDSKPYWEARKVARQVHTHSQTFTHKLAGGTLRLANRDCERRLTED